MFFRKKFVTNSSTTSFIAWGLAIPSNRYEGDDNTYDEFLDDLYEAVGGVEGSCAGDENYYLIFIQESHTDLDDFYGVLSNLDNTTKGEVDPKWKAKVEKRSKQLMLNTEGIEPGWFFTRYGS